MASADVNLAIPSALQANLDRLRQLNTQSIQANWRQHSQEIALADIFTTNAPIAALNDRQHIAWERGRHILWLYQTITVPSDFHGYPLAGMSLRLGLTWWADEAQIYVDGHLVQTGDLFECFTRICLSPGVMAGQTFQIALRLVSPGHDEGALVRSHLFYELPDASPTPEPSFVADELTVLATLEPACQTQIQTALSQLAWSSLTKAATVQDLANHPFQQSLAQLRANLIPLAATLKQRQIQCVGHAHLDMAWLWPVADTWDAAERTFRSVLDLQKDFPTLTYTHSSPALFAWLERNRPELFKQIQQKVSEGSWSIDAGLWIEPEFNLVSGEAIARHLLYGQRYCQEKFGQISKIAWLPDSFGFCWQLPQLLTQGGIETFATLKLSWNDTTEFPHQLFWWQSPDGSRILSLMLPPIGSDIDPVKMSAHAKKWEDSTGIPNTLWLPGLGDHGGGPTRDMLEKAQRWEKSPFFPQLTFITPNTYIDNLPLPPSPLSTWNNELYLELHRGCYTTHADQKQQNRRCEDLLYQAEVFATIAQLTASQPYPKADLEAAWKALLFNQFHDILPGTAIPEVFVDANQGWQKVSDIGQRVLGESIGAIASQINLSQPPHPKAKPIVIFNSLSWPRSSVITLPISETSDKLSPNWAIYNSENQSIPCQTSSTVRSGQAVCNVSFSADIPAVGYQSFWLCPGDRPTHALQLEQYILENEFLKATLDPKTGCIASLVEKITQTEALSASSNQLQAFQDKGQYWDAWNIDPDYANHPLPAPKLQSIRWLENGDIYQRLRVTYQFQQSTISHIYSLEIGTPYLKIETDIDWQETQVLLKTNFSFTVSSETATYEIPFGAIRRITRPQTTAEKAQWEVPALRWADIGSPDFGVSILTDCKHGFDAGPSHLRLTLLKSPIWPDPSADKGHHHFTYAIYPHSGTWQSARTVHHARELNIPPIVYQGQPKQLDQSLKKGAHSFLQIHNPNLILSALKPAESDPNEFVLRCYEAHGESAVLASSQTLGLGEFASLESDGRAIPNPIHTNLLEMPTANEYPTHIKPWQISTYRLSRLTDLADCKS
ncbi:alpha-mannosidase [Leptolyngbya sp. BC1307]|uniref:alpha-mannosidase n=1 Tax=Leptolyngbya sp. BC1307 TaxID=2029589 RepID=UPI000EFAC567|nr:alpha-mannosidase [Leptolyngbya sp. BC1307]